MAPIHKPRPQWCPCCRSKDIEIKHLVVDIEAGDYEEENERFEDEWEGTQYACLTCKVEFIV